MFSLMGFYSLAQTWSLGQKDVGSNPVNSSSSLLWNEMVFSFLLFRTSPNIFGCILMQICSLLSTSFSTILFSSFLTLQSQISLKTCLHSLALCSYLVLTQHLMCQLQSALSLHSVYSKVTSDFHSAIFSGQFSILTPNTGDHFFLIKTVSSFCFQLASLFCFLFYFCGL